MVEFAGYDMPLQYSGVRDEHLAVRRRAGVFDLSHMGEVGVRGAGAAEAMRRLVAGDVDRLAVGQAQYAVMCNDGGGIVDDVIVYRDAVGFMVVVNAACREKDVAWMRDRSPAAVEVLDESDEVALIAVQGPSAAAVVGRLTDAPLEALAPFHCIFAAVAGVRVRVSRTGYTGEDGLELYTPAGGAGGLWDSLLEAGRPEAVVPAGLAARDSLRLEAGLRLYGQDMDESVDPYSCGLGWTVRRDPADFIGAGALARLDRARPPRRFTGLALPERAVPRHGHMVRAGGRRVGEVTSGGHSFTLGHGIATAYIDPDHAAAPLTVDIRGNQVPAEPTPLPFYRRPRSGRATRAEAAGA